MLKHLGTFRAIAICISLLLSVGSALAQQAFTVKVVRTSYDRENDRCCYVLLVEKPSTLDANLIRMFRGIEMIDLNPGTIWDGLYYPRGDWTSKYIVEYVCIPADGADHTLTVQLNKWSDVGGVYKSDVVDANTIVVNCGGSKCCIEDKSLFKRELLSNDDGTCCTKLTLLNESSCGTTSFGVAGSISNELTMLSKVGNHIVICDDEAEIVFYESDIEGAGSFCKIPLSKIPVSGTIASNSELACCALLNPKIDFRDRLALISMNDGSDRDLPCNIVGLDAVLRCPGNEDAPLQVYLNGDVVPKPGSSSTSKHFVWIQPPPTDWEWQCHLCLTFRVRSSSCGTSAHCGSEICSLIRWIPEDPTGHGRWTAGVSRPYQQLDDEAGPDQMFVISDVSNDGRLSVTVPMRQASSVLVYSSLGQHLQTHSLALSAGKQEIQLPHKGVFLVYIQSVTGKVARKAVLYAE